MKAEYKYRYLMAECLVLKYVPRNQECVQIVDPIIRVLSRIASTVPLCAVDFTFIIFKCRTSAIIDGIGNEAVCHADDGIRYTTVAFQVCL